MAEVVVARSAMRDLDRLDASLAEIDLLTAHLEDVLHRRAPYANVPFDNRDDIFFTDVGRGFVSSLPAPTTSRPSGWNSAADREDKAMLNVFGYAISALWAVLGIVGSLFMANAYHRLPL